jgi:hypothetical protein
VTPLPAVFFVAVAALFQGRPAAAPPELGATVQFTPSPDFSGGWQAIAVELDSRTTRELDLDIRVEDDIYLAVATRHERLAPRARKRVFLYSPVSSYPRTIPSRWRITDDHGVELAAGPLPSSTRGYAPNQIQIGLFCRIPAAEDDFGIPTNINNIEVRCGRLSPATFPDRWIGLTALDLLVVHDAALDELTADQARALQDYVRFGGTMLVVPGLTRGWLSHPVLQSIAPIRAEQAIPAVALPGFAASFAPLRTGDTFLVQKLTSGAPALDVAPEASARRELVRFDVGAGRVFAVGVDLRHAPFDTWAGRRAFWTQILNQTPRWYQEDLLSFPIAGTMAQRDELFQRMSRLINPYPSFVLLIFLAVVFLGVVGPLNYTVLWRLRRTLLLVVTVPGISIGFLALIVLLGYVLKGTSTVVHSAKLLATRSGLDVARETHLYSLFSPANRTYDVSFEPGTYGPFNRWNDREGQYSRRRAAEVMTTITLQTGSTMSIRGLSAGQWQSWDLETRALRDLGKGVLFSVEGGRLRVENNSPRVIERGVFVQTGGETLAAPFPGLEPGKMVEAPLDGSRRLAVDTLGLGLDPLGDALVRPWLEGALSGTAPGGPTRRFLLCVLRDEGAPVSVDARLSGRSRSLTLLHVAEAP